MALTRRFFTKLASDFREARPASGEGTTAHAVWMHMVTLTANALSVQNAMFKHDKFYEACGMPDEVVQRVAASH